MKSEKPSVAACMNEENDADKNGLRIGKEQRKKFQKR